MIHAFPFDSRITGYDADGIPQYDHASNAEEFARLLASFLRNGVFSSEMCEVLATGGMSATVGVGSALIEGRYGYISIPESVQFAAAGERARIDTVVLRRDLSTGVNNMVCAVVMGVEASSPVAPALTRDGTVWEIGLADVLIPANSTAVAQNNITDTRLKDDRCGLVAAILTDVDTTHLYDQIQADMLYFKATEQASFEHWFEDVQNVLDGNTAGNLLNMINTKASTASRTVMIPVDGWTEGETYTQELRVEGVTEKSACHIIVSYAPSYKQQFMDCAVSVLEQRKGGLLFEVERIPEESFPVSVIVINPNANADDPEVFIPQRGVDYWTDADKQEIREFVTDAVLNGRW